MLGLSSYHGGAAGGVTREEHKGIVNCIFTGTILLCIFVEVVSIYRYFTGKADDLVTFIAPVIVIIFCRLMIFFNNKKVVNKYKKNGIKVIGKVEEIEKYTAIDNVNSRALSSEVSAYSNSGYGAQVYRVYVRVVNPHTGEEIVCISRGQSHPLDGYNLENIPVYFHKRNPKKYYVDVKEAIQNSNSK